MSVATIGRFTTDKRISKQVRTNRHFELGKKYAHVFKAAKILPDNVCETAIATCSIQIMGQFAHNDEGTALRTDVEKPYHGSGRWVHTSMQTYGNLPHYRFKRTGKTDRAIWVVGDSFDAANAILAPFKTNMDEVLHHFGQVGSMERKIIDLVDIIESLYAPYHN